MQRIVSPSLFLIVLIVSLAAATCDPVYAQRRAVPHQDVPLIQLRARQEGRAASTNQAAARYAPDLGEREAVYFSNGDVLTGRLQSIDPQTGVRWNHSGVEKPIHFAPEFVTEVRLDTKPPQAGWTNALQWKIRLTNGDTFQARNLRLENDRFTVETWFAGELQFGRTNVAQLTPFPPQPAPLYAGPEGTEDWTMGEVDVERLQAGVWTYKNGAFYAEEAASIGRDFDFPDKVSIQMDMAWKGTLHLAIALYTEYFHPVRLGEREGEPDFGGFYSLQLNSFAANLLTVEKENPIRYLGQAAIPVLMRNTSAHMDIRVDRTRGLVALLIDGSLVKQWEDPAGFIGTGRGLKFVHQGQGALRISNLVVRRWDGQFERTYKAPSDRSGDFVRLENGDQWTGQLVQINNEEVVFQYGDQTLHAPAEKVLLVALSPDQEPSATTMSGLLADGGNLSLNLQKWEPDAVAAISPLIGPLKFKPGAFERIELRIQP